MSLQYLKKVVRDEVNFLHAGKYQSFCMLVSSFLKSGQTFPKYPKYEVGIVFVIY